MRQVRGRSRRPCAHLWCSGLRARPREVAGPGRGRSPAPFPWLLRRPLAASCPAVPAASLGLARSRAPSPRNSKVMVLECGVSRHCCRSRGLMLQSASTCPCRTRSREIYMGRTVSRSCQALFFVQPYIAALC